MLSYSTVNNLAFETLKKKGWKFEKEQRKVSGVAGLWILTIKHFWIHRVMQFHCHKYSATLRPPTSCSSLPQLPLAGTHTEPVNDNRGSFPDNSLCLDLSLHTVIVCLLFVWSALVRKRRLLKFPFVLFFLHIRSFVWEYSYLRANQYKWTELVNF